MLTTWRTFGQPVPEQSLWHTARLPMTTSRSASSIAKFPLTVPLEPPTCRFCGWSSGITPVEPGLSTTAAPARSANSRIARAKGRAPPPALTATRRAPATSAAACAYASSATGAAGENAGAAGRASSRIGVCAGWVLMGRLT